MNDRDKLKSYVHIGNNEYRVDWGINKPILDRRSYQVKDIIIKNRFDFGEDVEIVSRPFITKK